MTNYLSKAGMSFFRIIVGTIIATVIIPFYILFPESILGSFPMKIFVSFLIIVCTFGYNNVQQIIKQIGLFYMVSFAAGGGLTAIHYMVSSSMSNVERTSFWHVTNINNEQIHLALLCVGFPFVLVLLKKVMDRQVKDKIQYDQLYPVWIEMNGRCEETIGFIDSGNQLSDPLTNKPVVIGDTELLKRFFTLEEWQAITQTILSDNMSLLPERVSDKFSVIPYQGVGGEAGCLYTLKPDTIRISMNGEIHKSNQVLIGIQLGTLTAGGTYHCLLHPELIQLKMMQSA